jgi:cytochrome c oxidase subunit I+III
VAFGVSIFYMWTLAGLLAAATLALILAWAWNSEIVPTDETEQHVGHGIYLPYYVTGPKSHAWWAMVVLIAVDAAAWGGLLFAYLYTWTVSPVWPPEGITGQLDAGTALIAAVLLALSAGAIMLAPFADRAGRRLVMIGTLGAAALLGAGGIWFLIDLLAASGFDPTVHAYTALVWMMVAWPAGHIVLGMIMALFCMAKATVRPQGLAWSHAVDTTALWWGWSAIQALVSLAIIVFYPQLV